MRHQISVPRTLTLSTQDQPWRRTQSCQLTIIQCDGNGSRGHADPPPHPSEFTWMLRCHLLFWLAVPGTGHCPQSGMDPLWLSGKLSLSFHGSSRKAGAISGPEWQEEERGHHFQEFTGILLLLCSALKPQGKEASMGHTGHSALPKAPCGSIRAAAPTFVQAGPTFSSKNHH